MKYSTIFKNGYAFQSADYVDDGISSIRIGDIKPEIDFTNTKKLPYEYWDNYEEFKISKGDILLALTGATIGKNCVFSYADRALLNQRVAIIRPQKDIISTYLNYLIQDYNFKQYIDFECEGGAQDNIGKEEIGLYKISLPLIPEQKQIVKYLDHKTAKIDSIIEKKKRLIELLKEERNAVINQAVTKGLDRNVRMKDSGIEWLGEIPEHWEVVKLKYLAKIKYGLGQPPKQLENGLPIIRATNISRGKIMPKDLMFIDPDDVPYDRDPVLRTDDIIVVRSGAYTADSAIVPKEFDGAITGYDMVVSPTRCNPNFIAFALLSNYVIDNQLIPLSLRAAQPHLNAEELGSTSILRPPQIEEQISIVKHIEKETTRIDSIISKSQKEIELLQEYRTALISEVVTGKIDIREEKI